MTHSLLLINLSANVDASVMYRRWKESDGKDEEYKTIIIRQVKKSQEDAKKDNVTSKQWNYDVIITNFLLRNYNAISHLVQKTIIETIT